MPRRSRQADPEDLRKKLVDLLQNFEAHLNSSDLREQVLELVQANHLLRDLGSSLISDCGAPRDRILKYLQKYVGQVISGDELMVVGGISEYARRVRELRVEHGWLIFSGATAAELVDETEFEHDEQLREMRPEDYMLLSLDQDREAAYRWSIAKDIRNEKIAVREKILRFLRMNVGKLVTGEELRYVAKGRTEWARRARELRTEYGWPIATSYTGRPDLPVGVYVLEEDRQSPPHDRKIPDSVRRQVMMRDGHQCQDCGWNHRLWNHSDPRHLEVHHLQKHVDKGPNVPENLLTLCNICHDERHRKEHSAHA